MSSVFTKASPAATSSICIVDSSDRTEKQQQQLQQCFSASSSSSSPSALSPTLPPTGNPTALSVQQHQYRTYTYYPSLPAAAKYNGPHLSIPPSTQLRSHFFHTAGAGQSPATGLALGSSPPYDSKIPSFSAQYTGQNTTSGGTGSYITSKVATTLLQLQDPVLHPLAAAPTSTYPPPPPPLKFVPGPPLQQLHSGGHEGSPTLDAPSSSASSPTQPTSYQSAAQFMFQTGHFPPSPYHHNPSPCWSHSPWPYLPFHGITGTTAAGGGGGTTGITSSSLHPEVPPQVPQRGEAVPVLHMPKVVHSSGKPHRPPQDPLRGETLQVPRLPPRVLAVLVRDDTHEDPLRGPSLQVQRVQQGVRRQLHPHQALPHPHRGEAIPVQDMRGPFLPVRELEQAHAYPSPPLCERDGDHHEAHL